MRAQKALSIIAFILVVVTNGVSVAAQEVVPDTPPELRDFRLDPPRTQPQPETQPPPTTEPTVTVTPPTANMVPEARQVEPTRRVRTAPVAPSISEPVASKEGALPVPETDAAPITPAPVTTTTTEADNPVSAEPALPYWQIAAALAAIGTLAAVALLFRRRRAKPAEEVAAITSVTEQEPAPVPVPAPVVKTAAQPMRQADIKIDFIPERATITFATLTIKGQLQISNEGQVGAKDMELRAGLISASHQQQQAIKLFFGTSHDITPNKLGEAKAGERIGLDLELSVPLSEMHSFPLGDQRLMVPIILATLQYNGGDKAGPLRVELASMIGREATPPQPKMGPLRLDLGPRSFAPLGTRPLTG